MRLFSWFVLRRLRQEPLRSAVTSVGIALGVAVIVAIQLTNSASVAGFQTALDIVSGQSSLEIVGTGLGVDETRLVELNWLRDYGEVAPVIQGDVAWRRASGPPETLRVLGIDILRDRPFREYELLKWEGGQDEPTLPEFLELLRDPSSAILTAKFASAAGLTVGSTLPVQYGDRSIRLTVRGLLADEGPARVLDGHFVLMDIAGAQELLDRFGRVDRLELRLVEGISVDRAETEIGARLPRGFLVQRPAQRGRQVENMLAAFHLNLTALSYIALLVGLFLVYNTVSVTVLSRRDEVGTLRALGATRGRVRLLFLGEAAVLALVGSGLGLLLSRFLADGAIALTSTTVTALYIAAAAAPPSLGMAHVALALGTALPLSLLAAFVPAQEAASVSPTAAMRGSDRLEHRRKASRRLIGVGLGLLALGVWLSRLPPVGGLPLFAYASALMIIFGSAFLVPFVLFAVVLVAEPLARHLVRVEYWLAVNNLSAAIQRLSISVAALAVSLSMMVAIAIMIGSFRETVIYWVGQTLQADLFVSPGSRPQPGADETLSPEVVSAIAASPDVAAVDRFRVIDVPYGTTGVRVGGGEFDVLLAHGSLLFKEPEDARAAMRSAIGRTAVVVSESFAIKHGVGAGDEVELPTPGGVTRFRVAAVYYDYSSDRGIVMMDRPIFERYFGNVADSGVTVYLREGADPEQARQLLYATIGDGHSVFIGTNRSLRAEVLRIFDSTFAITYALEIVAIVVAILGVSGTLVTLILEREREFTILRLIGTGRRQIRRIVIGEAVLIGAISQSIGLIVGFALSLLLIYVVNVQSFGWTIQFHLPVSFLVQSSALMVAATALAGLYPARRAVRLALTQDE